MNKNKIINIGILAHIDAGKTSLTERILFEASIIKELGSVDKGTTQMDTLDIEKERGITIKSVVTSFKTNGTKVNIIDTPGHPDFISEVDRILSVLDGVILVVSAVEGVQAQTITLMKILKKMNLPVLIFVNKIDRKGADIDRVVKEIQNRLSDNVITLGETTNAGENDSHFLPFRYSDETFLNHAINLLGENSTHFSEIFIKNEGNLLEETEREFIKQVEKGLLYPIVFGSAKTGETVDYLINQLVRLFPSSANKKYEKLQGYIFKMEKDERNESVAYARIFSGEVNPRRKIQYGDKKEDKITRVLKPEEGAFIQSDYIPAGDIAIIYGLNDTRIGDYIGEHHYSLTNYFSPPTITSVIHPVNLNQKMDMYNTLKELEKMDPTLQVYNDTETNEVQLSLYREVQKEVISKTLMDDYQIEVTFENSNVIYIERIAGTGEAVEFLSEDTNPFIATVGLRIEPNELNGGNQFVIEVENGAMPKPFFRAIEETIYKTLKEGLYGYEVHDCIVYLTHTEYWARQSASHGGFDKNMSSKGSDFRLLTPLVLMKALKKAGTHICEPYDELYIEIPKDSNNNILSLLSKNEMKISSQTFSEDIIRIKGEIPTSNLVNINEKFRDLTGGEGILMNEFLEYRKTYKKVSSKKRNYVNPLNRKEYLLSVLKGY